MATHILIVYESQDSEVLFRADDGIGIGQRKRTVVVYGEEPNKKQSRVFIDNEHAGRFLRGKVCQDDLDQHGGGTVDIDVRSGEGLVVLPADLEELPGGVNWAKKGQGSFRN